MHRRKFIYSISAASAAAMLPGWSAAGNRAVSLDLSTVRKEILAHCDQILDKLGPYGCYRRGPGQRPDLYASCDVAIMRAIMGEDYQKIVTDKQRQQWIYHINTFASELYGKGIDGSYQDTFSHPKLHANGMVIGALGVLGGKQKYPVLLYDPFDKVEEVIPWLEHIDWAHQWTASHLFWGGIHCYSMSSRCSDEWRETVFRWLNKNIDERTGWWRKGVPHADRHQALGGSVHILPIYQHHQRPFPYPGKIIDSVLQLQLPNHRWLQTDSIHVMNYLELDALYALKYMSSLAPDYKTKEIRNAVNNYGDVVIQYWKQHKTDLFALHPHYILAATGTFGLLQQLLPERFNDPIQWTDIFSDRRFYLTNKVEVFA